MGSQSAGTATPEAERSRATGFLDSTGKETKRNLSSLPPTPGPFPAGTENWQVSVQGAFMKPPV